MLKQTEIYVKTFRYLILELLSIKEIGKDDLIIICHMQGKDIMILPVPEVGSPGIAAGSGTDWAILARSLAGREVRGDVNGPLKPPVPAKK